MALSVSALSARLPFGSVVRGLRLADLNDDDTRAALRDLWIDRGLLIFKGVGGGADGHVKLSEAFGAAEVHPMKHGVNHDRPELLDLLYKPDSDKGMIYEVEGRRLGNYLPWHSDLIYVDRINHGGILRPLEIPPSGTQTGFIDRIATYQALPERLKQAVEGMEIIYKLDFDASRLRFGRRKDVQMIRMSTAATKVMANAHQVPRVTHPAVFEQPETGRKVLNVSPWFAIGIKGMENAEGDRLLEELADHASDETFAYYHDWAMDDLVLWDNWRMLHCAPGVPEEQTRYFQRTTIAGDYALGRCVDEMEIADSMRMNI